MFADVTPDSTITVEEVFGPVLAMIASDTAGEAVEPIALIGDRPPVL